MLRETTWAILGLLCLTTQSRAETVVNSLGMGIDEVSSVLEEYENKCSYPTLSEDLEDSVSLMERVLESEKKRLENIESDVLNAFNETRDLIQNYYQVFPTPPPEPCSHPFERKAGGCFWPHMNPTLSFNDARAYCQQVGGDLATPDDMGAVKSYLASKFGTGWTTTWIGGINNHRDEWKWVTTYELMNLDDSFFLSTRQYRADGSCAALHGRKGFGIMMKDCDETNWFLCERKV